MSEVQMIRDQQISLKKQARAAAVIAAKTALRSLVQAGIYAQGKPVEEINTAEMAVHLDSLTSKQEEIQAIDQEIKELSY